MRRPPPRHWVCRDTSSHSRWRSRSWPPAPTSVPDTTASAWRWTGGTSTGPGSRSNQACSSGSWARARMRSIEVPTTWWSERRCAGLEEMGESAPAGLELHCTNRIPHGRGWLILGRDRRRPGACAGTCRRGIPTPDDEAPSHLAIDIEGHPDNVAPAVLGGFCIGWVDESGGHAVRLDPHDSLMAVGRYWGHRCRPRPPAG